MNSQPVFVLCNPAAGRVAVILSLLWATGCAVVAAKADSGAASSAGDAGQVGASCQADPDCTGSEATCLTADAGFPAGYCVASCDSDGGCPSADLCVSGLFSDTQGNSLPVCLESCNSGSTCRPGYICLNASGQSFCWPGCKTDSDCLDENETCNTETGTCAPAAPATDAGPAPDGGSVVTVPLTGCAIVGYSAQVTLGGSQTFAMSIDTGSTTTGVAATDCSNCDVSPEYTPGPTASATGQLTSSVYGSGSWQAAVYVDTVQVKPEMPAVSMYFAAITSQSEFFIDQDCSGNMGSTSQGILGMGPLDLDTIGTNPGDAYFPALVQAAGISNLFAVQLCALGGRMWLGGYDSSIMTGPPQYTPIVPLNSETQPYYAVGLSDVGIAGVSLGATDYGPSLVDTGTYGFLMPDDAFTALVTAVSASPGATQAFGANKINMDYFNNGNCINAAGSQTRAEVDAEMPPMSLTFPTAEGGSFTLHMPATESYLIPITSGGTTCYLAGAASSGGIAETVIGASVQAANISIFDPANNRIGFAPATGCSD